MTGKTKQDYAKDYTQPKLREELKEKIKEEGKGGRPGQWSARKSQLLVKEYEAQGGDYKHKGHKTKAQKELSQWTEEDWQTADGKVAIRDHNTWRYLPKEVWEKLSEDEKKQVNTMKLSASQKGVQHVANIEKVREILKNIRKKG